MNITISKDLLLGKLTLASRFTSTKFSSLATLQNICLKAEGGALHIYASNLSSFFHSSLKADRDKNFTIIFDSKKTIEFLSLVSSPKVELSIQEKQLTITGGKSKGAFPLIPSADYPFPPQIKKGEQKLKSEFLTRNLPLILFSTSQDETRPVLNGVQFQTDEETVVMVTTDGFRLSLTKTKKEIDIPQVNIPASFLSEVLHYIEASKEVRFFYSEEEKMVVFKSEETEFYSRLIQGEFPPYEKVIPTETTTTVTIDREELIRNIKLVAIFARDYSNVVVFDIKKTGLSLRPKIDAQEENQAFQEYLEFKGAEQKIAFNFKFLLDLLGRVTDKKIKIEILRPDAPAVFRIESDKNYLHIIMPVRVQE